MLDMYNFVHKKNKEIIPLVDETMKKMKESGELEKLRQRIETEYTKTGLLGCNLRNLPRNPGLFKERVARNRSGRRAAECRAKHA
jgi:hypothetical protein